MRTTALLCTVLLLGSCTAPQAPTPTPVPPSTTEPKSRPPEVRSFMWRFATSIWDLNEAFSSKTAPTVQAVGALLDQVEKNASALESSHSDHPVVKQGLKPFAEGIAFARSQLSKDPPDFGAAKNLVGNCASCHELRDCPFNRSERCIDAPIY